MYLFLANYITQILINRGIIEKTALNYGGVILISMSVLFVTFKLLDRICKN